MHYLRNQNASIKWRSEVNSYFRINKGVRQGGILSPFLFKLYIDAILDEICTMNEGCTFGIYKMNILVYVDDIVLIKPSVREMDILYRAITAQISYHHLKMNKTKTKCMLFGDYKSAPGTSTLRLGDDDVWVVMGM